VEKMKKAGASSSGRSGDSSSSPTRPVVRSVPPWGQVRASPSGSCLTLRYGTPNDNNNDKEQDQQKNKKRAKEWHAWRAQHLEELVYPPPGFRHLHPIHAGPSSTQYSPLVDKWRLVPECLQLRSLLRQHIDSFNHFVTTELTQIVVNTPVNQIIKSDYDPKFFVRYEKIWLSDSPTIDEDSFYTTTTSPQLCRLRDLTYSAPLLATIRYTRGNHVVEKRGVCVGRIPVMVRSQHCVLSRPTPDKSGDTTKPTAQGGGAVVGSAAMLASSLSSSSMASHVASAAAAQHKECPYDPGGYFIIKGVEKAILIQEQLSKNRVILEASEESGSNGGATPNAIITASITSSTHERKSKSYILWKHGRVYLKNNTLGDDVPIVIVLRAMGMESDYEIVSWIAGASSSTEESESKDRDHGGDPPACDSAQLVSALALSLEDAQQKSVRTQSQALLYIGSRIRNRNHSFSGPPPAPAAATPSTAAATASTSSVLIPPPTTARKPLSPEEEARDVLAHVVLSHISVDNYDFQGKAIYICNIVRRVLLVHLGHVSVDDKDYYGNKRLELAGNLLSLLFEDLFKLFNKDLKRQADLVLSKPNRASAFDVVKTIRPDTITHGMVNAIATGNWVLKRFRMDRAGVTQVVSRLSYLSALGMMTRINSQFEKTRKVSGPRSLQPSQWGMLCPADTPEGTHKRTRIDMIMKMKREASSRVHTVSNVSFLFRRGVRLGQELGSAGARYDRRNRHHPH
jgi:DNA-directed RNA polymerase III subunit RPC2